MSRSWSWRRSAVVLAVAVSACGSERATLPDDTVTASAAAGLPERPTLMNIDQIGMEGGRGVYIARRDAGETRIAFDVPVAQVAPDRRHDMEQIGQTPDGVVLLLDRYASRRDDAGRCADGRETFVRAFSLTARRELFARPVESCLDGIVAADPPVRWLGEGRFRIEGAAPITYVITGADRVAPIGPERTNG